MEIIPRTRTYTFQDVEIDWRPLNSGEHTEAMQDAVVLEDTPGGGPKKAEINPSRLVYARVAWAIQGIRNVTVNGEDVIWSALDRGGRIEMVRLLPPEIMNPLVDVVTKASILDQEDERSPSESPAE